MTIGFKIPLTSQDGVSRVLNREVFGKKSAGAVPLCGRQHRRMRNASILHVPERRHLPKKRFQIVERRSPYLAGLAFRGDRVIVGGGILD
jgi:hypothetical protein